MIRDRNIQWKRKKVPVNLVDFSSVIGAAGVNAGLAAGVNVFQEIAALNLAGVLFDTAADAQSHYMDVPYDLDPDSEIGFKVKWTSGSSTTADTITWAIKCDLLAEGANLIEATTVLDTVIAEDTVTGTPDCQWTSRGIKNKGALTQAQVDAGATMVFTVLLGAFAAGLDEDKFALSVVFDYKVKACD